MMTSYLRGTRRRWTGEIATEHLPEPDDDGGIDAALLALPLRSATDRLPPRQRACIVLRNFLDLSELDTAAALGSSLGAVKSKLPAHWTGWLLIRQWPGCSRNARRPQTRPRLVRG